MLVTLRKGRRYRFEKFDSRNYSTFPEYESNRIESNRIELNRIASSIRFEHIQSDLVESEDQYKYDVKDLKTFWPNYCIFQHFCLSYVIPNNLSPCERSEAGRYKFQ